MPTATFTISLPNAQPRLPLSIYHLAQAFYLAGSRNALIIVVGARVNQSLVSPAVVCYCFSIELFCKALIQEVGTAPPRTHRLSTLFSQIPADAKLAIESDYSSTFSDPDLTTLVNQASNYFQEVRYSYEYDIFNYQETPLATLALSMYVYCKSRFDPDALVEAVTG